MHRTNKASVLLLAACIFSCCVESYATDFPAASVTDDAASKKLSQLLEPIENLSGTFVQHSLGTDNNIIQTQSGSFIIKSSGEFRWIIDPPYAQRIASDGEVIRSYDPDLETLTVRNAGNKFASIPLLLFSRSNEKALQEYRISYREPKTGSGADNIDFKLAPKSSESLFSKLHISFDHELPAALEITDQLQQNTRILFDDVAINQSIDDDLFQIEVPEGTDLIDEREPN